jgi:toxin ParE1/3/4
MKRYKVRYAPEFEDRLDHLEAFIETASGSERIAEGYTDAIKAYCESMTTAPERGIKRDDLAPGLRITNYKGAAVIAFVVENDLVSFVDVFYGGQDYDAILATAPDH